jgi:AcrR family transcriptional regulator
MPTSPEKPLEAAESARERILLSAMELFANRGFGNTSVRAIAKCAGVSQGLMYIYFKSKDDLLKAIFERGMRDVRASWQLDDGTATPYEKIESLLRKSFAILKEHATFWRLIHALRMQPEVLETLALELGQLSDLIQEHLTALCREAGLERPEIEAKVLFAFIDGVAQQLVMAPDGYPIEDVIESLLKKYR